MSRGRRHCRRTPSRPTNAPEDLEVNMKNIVFNSDKEGFFDGKIVLQISDVESLELLMTRIKAIEGIMEVVRID